MNTKVHLFGSRDRDEIAVGEDDCIFCCAAAHYDRKYDAFEEPGDMLFICDDENSEHVHEVIYLGTRQGLPVYTCRCVKAEYARRLAATLPN